MVRLRFIFFAFFTLLVIFLYSRNLIKTEQQPIHDNEEVTKKPLTWIDSIAIKYDSLLKLDLEESKTIGATVAIVYKDEIVFTECYGVKKAGETDSINENTIFRLASVSKAVTGILAGIMANEGIIGLDDKVVDYLPNFRLKDSINTNNLTIRNLLSHTSGLVPHAYDNLVEAKVEFKTIIDSMFRVDISAEPGKLYSYQNVMFSLYDTISALKTSKKFGSLLKEKLFGPYNMQNASSGFAPFSNNRDKAFPHTWTVNGFVPIELNDKYYNTIPAAGINASISDMANLLLHFLNDDSIHHGLQKTVLEPQVYTPLRRSYFRQWGKVDSRHYALGWRIVGYRGKTIAYHGGYVRGYRAELALCREENIGIVFLSNSPSSSASKSIPLFLNLFFDTIEQQNNIDND